MLTAAEARKLSGWTAEEYVENVLESVKEEAEKGNRKLCAYTDFWTKEGYDGTAKYKKAVDILKDLGYNVRFVYEELQFVNVYTLIEW